MSTSPEAKQAAGEWGKSGFSQRERDIFAEGYDAATAKLRKELERMEGSLLCVFDWATRNAPYPECKIEGNTLLQDICEKGLGYWPLAHQQLSPPSDGLVASAQCEHTFDLVTHIQYPRRCVKCGARVPLNSSEEEGDMRERPATRSGSSAPPVHHPGTPTPDVEKIARGVWDSIVADSERHCKDFTLRHSSRLGSIVIGYVTNALAQARAPLVGVLESIKIGAPDIVRRQIDAALTGTE